MSVRNSDESPRRKITTLREEARHYRAEAEEHIGKIESIAASGTRSHSAEEMVERFERKAKHAERKAIEADEKADELQAQLDSGGRSRGDMIGAGEPARIGQEPRFRRGTSQADGVTLAPEQRMADWAAKQPDPSGFTVADADEFCIGNIMRALVEPRFRSELSDVERRALAEGTDSAGGFISPEVLSVNFIDKVRKAGRVFEAGATTVPLDSDTHSIPRLSGDPTFSWRNENTAFGDTDATFERVTFDPQSGGFIVKTSEELYQDMVAGAGAIIENALIQTAALELDRVALRGTGTTPEPRGVLNQSGVTLTSMGANGATPAYSDVMAAITRLLTDNRQPNAWMHAPRTSQKFAGLTDSTGQPLNPPKPVADLTEYVTSQIPVNLTTGTSTDTSEIYVGYWPDLLVGIRLGIQLRLLQERYADNGQFAWRVFLRADVQLAHPESFEVITGVRAV